MDAIKSEGVPTEIATPVASATLERGAVVYRVQDGGGRGPFKPFKSHRWLDDDERDLPPPFFQEFGAGIFELMDSRMANGCALETLEQVHLWFSPTEMRRLHLLGYRLVKLRVDVVLAASENQLVVARKRPFRQGAQTIPWPPADGAKRQALADQPHGRST